MVPPRHIQDRLRDFGALSDDDIPLTETALLLAQIDRPGSTTEPYERHLRGLVEDVRAYVEGGRTPLPHAEGFAEALAQVLVKRHGYFGTNDVFDDVEGANLMRCIERRSGLPAALTLIYLHVARGLGRPMEAIDFPGRVLARLDHPDGRLILDPFDAGATLDAPAMRALLKTFAGREAELSPDRFKTMSNRRVLVRLFENVKIRFLRSGDLEKALTSVETMLMFAPGLARLWREAGILHARLDHLADAVDALEQYLEFDTRERFRYDAGVLLRKLKGRMRKSGL